MNLTTKQCAICAQNNGQTAVPDGFLYEDRLWLLKHVPRDRGVPGWLLMQSRRHLAGIHEFNEEEAHDFGPFMKRLQTILLEVSGAKRIYIASMNESVPHFHCHLVPRYETMPMGAVGWSVFDLMRAAENKEYDVDGVGIVRIRAELVERLASLRAC